MEAFQYQALDAAGRTVSGVVQADTARQARTAGLGAGAVFRRGEPGDQADGDVARLRPDDGAVAQRPDRSSLRGDDARGVDRDQDRSDGRSVVRRGAGRLRKEFSGFLPGAGARWRGVGCAVDRAATSRRLPRRPPGAETENRSRAALPRPGHHRGARDRHRAASLRGAAGGAGIPAVAAEPAAVDARADRIERLPARDLAVSRRDHRRHSGGRTHGAAPRCGKTPLARLVAAHALAGFADSRRQHVALRQHACDSGRGAVCRYSPRLLPVRE